MNWREGQKNTRAKERGRAGISRSRGGSLCRSNLVASEVIATSEQPRRSDMGLVFPLALLTSLKLAMNTTPYLPGASASKLPSVADPWPPVLSMSPFRRGAAAAAANSDYDAEGVSGESGEDTVVRPQFSSPVEQRGWSVVDVLWIGGRIFKTFSLLVIPDPDLNPVKSGIVTPLVHADLGNAIHVVAFFCLLID